MACEEKVLLELRFQLRKPYNEAETLIDAFNQIIEEGGRAIISVSTKLLILYLYIYSL